MKLLKELNTVTSLSRYLAMALFIALPFIGFFIGMRYQEMLDLAKRQQMESNLAIPRVPTPTLIAFPTLSPSIIANWKTYENTELGFEFKYPEVYKDANKGQNARSETLVFHIRDDDAVSIKGFLGTGTFDLENIRKAYAPTGNESLPEPVAVGQYKFYRYGPGGGGVFYPDRYFFDLNGKLLIFEFFENRQRDKTPSKETKQLEADVLATFKFTP